MVEKNWGTTKILLWKLHFSCITFIKITTVLANERLCKNLMQSMKINRSKSIISLKIETFCYIHFIQIKQEVQMRTNGQWPWPNKFSTKLAIKERGKFLFRLKCSALSVSYFLFFQKWLTCHSSTPVLNCLEIFL